MLSLCAAGCTAGAPTGQSTLTTHSSSAGTSTTAGGPSASLSLSVSRRVGLPANFVAAAAVASAGRLWVLGSVGPRAAVVGLDLTSYVLGRPVSLGDGEPTGIVADGTNLWLSVAASGAGASSTGFVTELSIPALRRLRTVAVPSPLALAMAGPTPLLLSGGSAGSAVEVETLPGLHDVSSLGTLAGGPVPGQAIAACGTDMLVAFMKGRGEEVLAARGGTTRSWPVPVAGVTYLACAGGTPVASVATPGGGTYLLQHGAFVRVKSSSDFGRGLTFSRGLLFSAVQGDGGPFLQAFPPTVFGTPTAQLALAGTGTPGAVLFGSPEGTWVADGTAVAEVQARLVG